MFKIAFFDIDGTIIDMNKKVISDRMVETLKALQAKGIKICVATGRPPIALPSFNGVIFDGYLTFNASYCYTQQEVVFKNPIPNRDVQKIIKNSEKLHRPVLLATKTEMGGNGMDPDLMDYMAISKQVVNVVENFEDFSKQDIYQIMIGCYKEEYEEIMKEAPGARLTAWWDRAADIIPANGGKGIGVRKMLEYFGLTKEDAIAFGDGTNDIEMLEAVGTAVAMENATDDLKRVADDVCGHVKDEGIYYYCKEHGLI